MHPKNPKRPQVIGYFENPGPSLAQKKTTVHSPRVHRLILRAPNHWIPKDQMYGLSGLRKRRPGGVLKIWDFFEGRFFLFF